jgi:cephalosporin-C deacetylase-like acetyl esterase
MISFRASFYKYFLVILALTACGSGSSDQAASAVSTAPSADTSCQPPSANAVYSDALKAQCDEGVPTPALYVPNLPIAAPPAPSPTCTTDHFVQNGGALGRKLDVLFVVDTTSRISERWQQISKHIDALANRLAGIDVRYAVILAHVDQQEGVLYAPQGEPRVLDSTHMTTKELSLHLRNIFWSTANAFDDRGIGEAAFYSLHKLVTKNLASTRGQGFLRSDAGLAVLFQSDEEEIGYPAPSHPPAGVHERCDAYYPPTIRKEFYTDQRVSLESTFAAVKAAKNGQLVSMNAFVNVNKEDMEHYIPVFQSPDGKPCVYASPGYGYFEMVAKTGGLLRSVHEDTERSLDRLGRAIHDGVDIQHDFYLSHPSSQVDPTSIKSLVDGGVAAHSYSPSTDVVHLDYAGKMGSKIAISYCQPQGQTQWQLTGFAGSATQTAATLTWQTSALATSGKILWGTSTSSLTQTAAEGIPATNHSVVINGLTASTTYYFQAVSTDTFGTEKRSSVISLTTQAAPLPDWAITGFAGSSTQTTVALTFATSTYATLGKVMWGTSADSLANSTLPDSAAVKAHKFSVTGLTANTTYYFQASATDDHNRMQQSAVIAITTQPIPLPSWAITGFTGTPSQTSVALAFTTSAYATTGKVLWGTDPASLDQSTSADAAPATSHAFTVSGLTPATTYYFQATASDDRGQTQSSAVIAVTTSAIPLPTWAITGFTGATTQTSAALTFNTSDYATTGAIRWGTSAGSLTNVTPSDESAVNAHAFSVTGLASSTTYYFQAVATDDRGQQKTSAVISLNTAAIPLPVWTLTGFAGTPAQNSVALTFSTLEYGTTGKVLWGTSASSLTNVAGPDSTPGAVHNYTVNGLAAATTYYFQASATDDRGQSKKSEVISVTTNAVPLPVWSISGFTGTPAQTTIALAFNTAEYATKGKVLWGTSASSLTNTTATDPSAMNAHAFTVSGLTANTTYYFQATASDDRGQTHSSEVIAVTTAAIPLPVWSITGFAGTPTQTSAALTFETADYATTGKILWGTSADTLNNVAGPDSAAVKSHAFTVSGLLPSTTYYFQAAASDDLGQTKSSAVISVTTAAIPLPVWSLTGFAGTTTQTSASLSFATSAYATTGYVLWGTSADSLTNVAGPDSAAVKAHAFTVGGLAASTTYFFQAVASDDRGQTKSSAVISLTTAAIPLPMWSITGFAGMSTQTTAALSFSTSAYATTGKVLWGTSAGSLTNVAGPDSSAVTAHAFTVSGLTAATTYFFQAVASDDRGQTKSSAVISITTAAIPLPTWSLTDFAGTSTQTTASLSFNTSEYVTTGKVLWGTSAGSLTNVVGPDSSPAMAHAFTVSGLTASTTYYFQAVASDDRGQTKSSAVIAVTTASIPLPTWSISGFGGTGDSQTTISVGFATPEYATTGQILWGTSASALSHAVGPDSSPVTSHSYNVTGLTAGTTYFFQAVASDDRGQTKSSAVIAISTPAAQVPWNLTGFDGTSTSSSVSLIWNTGTVATTGLIHVGLSASDLTLMTLNVTSATNAHVQTITGLTPGTTYFFQVDAADTFGTIHTSGVISKTTKAAAPKH